MPQSSHPHVQQQERPAARTSTVWLAGGDLGEAVSGAVLASGALLLDQGLDMGGGLDLRAFVVAAPVNGEHFVLTLSPRSPNSRSSGARAIARAVSRASRRSRSPAAGSNHPW
jgi:hypothetical protein